MPQQAPTYLSQHYSRPTAARPIIVIGAGGIVNDAHLPAYAHAGFDVAGVFDPDRSRAQATAARFGINAVFASLDEAVSQQNAVFDIAVPPEHVLTLIEALPDRSIVLIQKPLGRSLQEAKKIRDLCRAKSLTAAVNFQLRYAPAMLAIRDAIQRGMIGHLRDIEVRVNCRTPWELFPYLKDLPRVEILMHSIHYLDLIRSIAGDPQAVQARTISHPDCPQLHSTRTTAILDYGDSLRCSLAVNHHYQFAPRHQASHIRLEGSNGAAVAKMGVNLNYPQGEPDELEIVTKDQDWAPIELSGSWFPQAFKGPMANLQRYAAGEDETLRTSVEDAYRTMAVVESCYQASERGGVPVPE